MKQTGAVLNLPITNRDTYYLYEVNMVLINERKSDPGFQ